MNESRETLRHIWTGSKTPDGGTAELGAYLHYRLLRFSRNEIRDSTTTLAAPPSLTPLVESCKRKRLVVMYEARGIHPKYWTIKADSSSNQFGWPTTLAKADSCLDFELWGRSLTCTGMM